MNGNNENLFESSQWNPSGNYGKFDDLIVKEARGVFSRYNLALFLYSAVAYAVILGVDLLLSLILPSAIGTEKTLEIFSSVWYQWLMGVGPMYIIGFPVFLLIVRNMPTKKREKKKLKAIELFYMFLVAEGFMLAGNLIGQSLNASISAFLGREIQNETANLIASSPVWLIFIIVVIVGPIIEELLFRKLMIDRISKYGDTLAIVISAVAFGLFHGNFYQFFYAAFLGLLLGYVYCQSGNVKYTVALHMIINFIGSVAIIPLLKYEEILLSETIPETGAELREFFIAIMAMGSYSVIQYVMAIAGIVIFINAIRYRLIKIDRNPEIKIPQGRTAGAVLGNVGTILFLVFSIVTFALNIFLV